MGDRASSFSISRRTVFGLDIGIRDAVQYIDHGSVVYCAGKSTVAYDVAGETQKFLQISRNVREITAIATHVATCTIALATLDDDGAQSIAIYDAQSLKREKVMTRSDVKPRRVADASAVPDAIGFDGLAFSKDGASLLAYSTIEHALVVWSVRDGTCVELPRPRQFSSGADSTTSRDGDTSQFASNAHTQITHALFSPHEDDVVSAVCVGGVFRTYRVNETTIKLLSATPLNELVKDVGREVAAHAWLHNDDKHVAVGTSTGEVLILEHGAIVCVLNVARQGASSDEGCARRAVGCVRAYKNGFIVGDARGRVSIVERCARKRTKDGGVLYKCVKTLIARETKDIDAYDASNMHSASLACAEPVPNDAASYARDNADEDRDDTNASSQDTDENHHHSIVALDISPSGDNLMCTLDDKRALALSLANVDIMRADEMRFTRVLAGAHLGAISSADVCARKSIIATVSATDHTVRIWTVTADTPSLDVVVRCPDAAPLSVALHPSGWIACVGFTDKLRLMHILNNDLRVVKELPFKACRVCEFAKGGHCVAAAVGAVVYVVHAFTFETLATLRGHCGKVKSIVWRDDDSTLITSGQDGAIYAWDMRTAMHDGENARGLEHVRKGRRYDAVAALRRRGGGLVACGDDSTLTELDDEFNVVRGFSSDGVKLTHVAYAAMTHRVFAATANGGVRAYKTPLTGEFIEYAGHVGAVTMMRLSADEASLYTVGEDGCVFAYDIRDGTATVNARNSTSKCKGHHGVAFARDEVLVMRGDLDESRQRIAELQTQIKEVTLHAQYQLRLKTAEMNDRVKTVEDECERRFSMERRRVAELERERDDLTRAARQDIEDMNDAHAKALADAEEEYARKMFAEVERFASLEASSAAAADAWTALQARMTNAHEESERTLKQECAMKVHALRDTITVLERECDAQREEFATLRRVMEDTVHEEIEQLKASYEARIKREHDAGLVLRGENGVAKTKYALVKQHEDARLQEIAQLKADAESEARARAERDAEAERLRERIRTHERTLDAKNTSMADAHTELTRAEKHIAVLAQEVVALREQQTPLRARARALERDIETTHEELSRYYDANSALVRQVRDAKAQRDGLQRDIVRTRKRGADTADVVKRFQRDLHDCANCIQDAKTLKERVVTMYRTYVDNADIIADSESGVRTSEEKRQRDHLEKTVGALKRQLASDADSRRVEFHRIMRENQRLMREVEALRVKSFDGVVVTAVK